MCDSMEDNELTLYCFKEKDICAICFKELYLEYMRIFEGQIPSRRGGFRKLGEYDS